MLPVKKLKADNRRPDGLQRELYSLLGSAVPPLAVVPGKVQAKPNWRQRVRPWAKTKFAPARADGLKFEHWAPSQVSDDNRSTVIPTFNQFNIKIDVPEWRDDSYHLFKRDDWTVEETEYLFDLCRLYDLHWMAVIDRYLWNRKTNKNEEESRTDHVQPRTLEELKERYYEVCSALLRAKDHLTAADEELLEQMKFPREREVQRKAHLKRLLSRTPAEVAEEEALVLEARRIESVSEKLLNDRHELLGLLDSYTSDGSIAQYQSSQGIAMLHQKLLQEKSRKVPPSQLDPAAHVNASKGGATIAANVSPTAAGAAQNTKSDAAKASLLTQVIQRKLSAKEQAAYGISYTDKHAQGVVLRSAKLPSLKASVASRVNALLEEMGLPARPVMVTARTAAKYEQIQQEATLLLETKRLFDRLEAEAEVQQDAGAGAPPSEDTELAKKPDAQAADQDSKPEASEASEASEAPKSVTDAGVLPDPSQADLPAGDHSTEARPDDSDDAMVIDG